MRENVARSVKKWAQRLLVLTTLLTVVGGVLWYVDSRTGHSWSLSTAIIWRTRYESWKTHEVARRWDGGQELNPAASAAMPGADRIFQKANIWRVDLSFGGAQWEALRPRKIGPMANFERPG